MFGSRQGFRGWRIEWTYFQLHQIQDGGWPPSWKISNGDISATDHPTDFVFDPRVGFFEDGRSNGPTSGYTKSKRRLPAISENFE